MAKKKSIYSAVGYEKAKQELDSVVDFLLLQQIESMQDDIDYKPTQKGGITPQVISKIEEKLKGIVGIIKTAAGLLINILESDGVTDYVSDKIEVLRSKLEEIQSYYAKRQVSSIQHRRIKHKFGVPGKQKEIEFIVATQFQQVADRTIILERILQVLPQLSKLEEATEAMDVKGDYAIPESLLMRGIN